MLPWMDKYHVSNVFDVVSWSGVRGELFAKNRRPLAQGPLCHSSPSGIDAVGLATGHSTGISSGLSLLNGASCSHFVHMHSNSFTAVISF